MSLKSTCCSKIVFKNLLGGWLAWAVAHRASKQGKLLAQQLIKSTCARQTRQGFSRVLHEVKGLTTTTVSSIFQQFYVNKSIKPFFPLTLA